MTEDGIPETAAEAVLMSRLASLVDAPRQCEAKGHGGRICDLEASYYVGTRCQMCGWTSNVAPVCNTWLDYAKQMACTCGLMADAEYFIYTKEEIK